MNKYNCIAKDEMTWSEVLAKLVRGETVSLESAGFSSTHWSWGDLVKEGMASRGRVHIHRFTHEVYYTVKSDISVQFWGETYTKGQDTPHIEVEYD